MTRNVLIVEDNADIARLLQVHLKELDCATQVASSGDQALALTGRQRFDLVVLDLMLPGLDGLEVCRQLRARPGYVPILMLTAKSSELDRVLGLELGADDYLTKPFSLPELMARIKALFRRVEAMASPGEQPEGGTLSAGDLTIHLDRREVLRDGQPVNLTAREFDLLVHFARHPGRVYTRAQLLDAVWGYGHEGYEHTVNSHINRLRAKIERDPARPAHVLTVWGVGYKFADP